MGEELSLQLPWNGVYADEANDAQEDAWDSTWADDTAYPILADSADELLNRTTRTCSLVTSTLRAHGDEAMPVVKSYKHLGGYLDARAGGKAEVRYRLSMAAVAFGAARGLILQNRSIPLLTRGSLFEVVVGTTFVGVVARHLELLLWKTE